MKERKPLAKKKKKNGHRMVGRKHLKERNGRTVGFFFCSSKVKKSRKKEKKKSQKKKKTANALENRSTKTEKKKNSITVFN